MVRRVSHPHESLSLIVTFIRHANEGRQASLIQAPGFGERPTIVPPEVRCLNVAHSGSLAENENTCYQLLRRFGSNLSCLFMSVQAITKSFAASFTRILVWIPRSRCRPLTLEL